jgi:hypothetical protein
VAILGFAAISEEIVPLTAHGAGEGRVAIHFYGSRLEISFETEMEILGSIVIDGTEVAFTAAGTADGRGQGDSGTLEATVWSTLRADGTTENGEPVMLRGGISVHSSDVDISTASAGAGSGLFYLAATVGEREMRFRGELLGDASGGFVPAPPDDPYAMVYAGAYRFDFVHAVLVLPASDTAADAELPWDLSAWPEEISAELLLLLSPPEADAEDAPPVDDSL